MNFKLSLKLTVILEFFIIIKQRTKYTCKPMLFSYTLAKKLFQHDYLFVVSAVDLSKFHLNFP